MNFIQKFLRNFDRRHWDNIPSLIDHGDPDALFMSPPTLLGSKVVKPPGSLLQFANKHHAGNGERVDPFRNAEVLCEIMPASDWRELEANALRAGKL